MTIEKTNSHQNTGRASSNHQNKHFLLNSIDHALVFYIVSNAPNCQLPKAQADKKRRNQKFEYLGKMGFEEYSQDSSLGSESFMSEYICVCHVERGRGRVPLESHGQSYFLCTHYNLAAGPNRTYQLLVLMWNWMHRIHPYIHLVL